MNTLMNVLVNQNVNKKKMGAIAPIVTSAAAFIGVLSCLPVTFRAEALSMTATPEHISPSLQPTVQTTIQAPEQTSERRNHGLLIAQNFDLNQAKNLARQRGEAENGGVSVYEAEPSMHGPAAEAPYVLNGNGSVTFTFRGRPRGSNLYDVETQVTVNMNGRSDWDIVTNYNREIAPTSVSYFDILNPD